MTKFIVLLPILLLSACSHGLSKVPRYTVMITNLAKNSGGSGSVIYRDSSSSLVLTNAHVCEVVKNGGLVHEATTGTTHNVVSFRQSTTSDLCAILIEGDVGQAAPLARFAPRMYDDATISGHPHLMPNIITKGHFSGKQIIPVLTGWRDCTPEDSANPDTAAFCGIIGKMPVVHNYQAIATSALIRPGSSGSAVYNDRGEISAVIFAGEGDLGFGYAVPHEYVVMFLTQELKILPTQVPNGNLAERAPASRTSNKELASKVEKACNELLNNQVCKLLESVDGHRF